jgi:UDP-N-acetylmuramoyl-tripeptide--D-alanyl-D-alanine ligase
VSSRWPVGADLRGAFVVEVADTVTALQALARHIRRTTTARVVAITGSAGKTTTKEITAELLSGRYRVFRNTGNLNNHIGLPLSLLELRKRPDIAVVELGMSHAGEISLLVDIAQPDVRVWTNVSDVHAEFFASVDEIADAKAEILEQAGPDTVLVANADDDRVIARTGRFAGRVVTFGIERPADVKARRVRGSGLAGLEAEVRTWAGDVVLNSPLPGRANLENLLAGMAVALLFDVPLGEIAERTRRLVPVSHRGEVLKLAKGVTVVDDSYNSNPAALRRALEVLADEQSARRAAVLGEMLELGAHSERLHEECGRAAAAAGLDWLVTVGGVPAGRMAAAAVDAGMAADSVRHLPTSAEAAEFVVTRVGRGDLVLVKGSRGIRTDLVVDRLRAEFT